MAISRCDPVFSGAPPGGSRRSGALPESRREVIAASVRCAFSQASSSVGAMIGRNATWNLGTSLRPASLAACLTDWICSAVWASGSPHRQKMSASAPPAL